MAPEEETVKNLIPLIMHVAVVLYKLRSCAEYYVVANQFGVQFTREQLKSMCISSARE